MSITRPSLLLVGAAALLAACGGTRAPQHAMGPEAAKARARADSAKYPYSRADIAFMSGMIHHHAQAIVMSRLAPTREASPAIIRLTERIINAQTDEILLMQTWLTDREQLAPVVGPDGKVTMPGAAEHAGHGDQHETMMPGMLGAEQMAQLEAARGATFDQLFLTFMIQHHRGAVTMVRSLMTSPGSGQDETVFKFASDVEVDQTTEIQRMLTMLYESPTPSTQRSPE